MVHLELKTLTFLNTHSPEAKGMAVWDGSGFFFKVHIHCIGVHGCVCRPICALLHLCTATYAGMRDIQHITARFIVLVNSCIYNLEKTAHIGNGFR